jgi:hypothetical protein
MAKTFKTDVTVRVDEYRVGTQTFEFLRNRVERAKVTAKRIKAGRILPKLFDRVTGKCISQRVVNSSFRYSITPESLAKINEQPVTA